MTCQRHTPDGFRVAARALIVSAVTTGMVAAGQAAIAEASALPAAHLNSTSQNASTLHVIDVASQCTRKSNRAWRCRAVVPDPRR